MLHKRCPSRAVAKRMEQLKKPLPTRHNQRNHKRLAMDQTHKQSHRHSYNTTVTRLRKPKKKSIYNEKSRHTDVHEMHERQRRKCKTLPTGMHGIYQPKEDTQGSPEENRHQQPMENLLGGAEENEHKKKEITRLVGIYLKGTDRLGEL